MVMTMKTTSLFKFLLVMFLLTIGYIDVFASDDILVCDYTGDNSKEIQIYYRQNGDWLVKYTKEDNSALITQKEGTFDVVFANKDSKIYRDELNGVYSSDVVSNYTCKDNAFIEYWFGDDKLCFTNDSACYLFSPKTSLKLNHSADTPFTYIDNQNPVDILKAQIKTYKEFLNADKVTLMQEGLNTNVANKFGLESLPLFLRTYIDEKLKQDTYDSDYQELVEGFIQEAENDPDATQEEKSALNQEKNWGLSEKAQVSIVDDTVVDTETDYFDHNCQDAAKVIRMVGYLILAIKILIPMIIIVKSSMNLLSTVTKGSQDQLKKDMQKLGISLVAGIAIFFVPTILDAVFNLVNGYGDNKSSDFEICEECIFHPLDNTCKTAAEDNSINPYSERMQ